MVYTEYRGVGGQLVPYHIPWCGALALPWCSVYHGVLAASYQAPGVLCKSATMVSGRTPCVVWILILGGWGRKQSPHAPRYCMWRMDVCGQGLAGRGPILREPVRWCGPTNKWEFGSRKSLTKNWISWNAALTNNPTNQ